MVQLDARPTDDQKVAGSNPARSAAFFMEIDHEIFPTVIIFFPLIQEEKVSVSGERMRTVVIYRFED